ncbi:MULTISPECIES: hypothetical protein [unclassified Pseudonocardia]|uniref:hypothetical protein n=1 Tax=unclassified Pseudonocardia TaxID=2619320 RepID=UPI001ACC90B7|nr:MULTISPECIES: hypothetical protein [unclassified Pseudonocardia]MBN9101976.1 hypothetical protein [Pseudonocardia sp.]
MKQGVLGFLLYVGASYAFGVAFNPQSAAGVEFTVGQVVGPIVGFVVLGVLGAVLLVGSLRGLRPR